MKFIKNDSIKYIIKRDYNNIKHKETFLKLLKLKSIKSIKRMTKNELIKTFETIEKIKYIENYILCDFENTAITAILDDFVGYNDGNKFECNFEEIIL